MPYRGDKARRREVREWKLEGQKSDKWRGPLAQNSSFLIVHRTFDIDTFDIDTFEPIEPPWQAIREWIPDDDAEREIDLFDQRPDSGKPVEIPREDGTILVLDSD